ncbi:MAG: hypothetical protein PHF56_19210 [Desulfuromonadaceae bacterium]|nr:hypothetical protein [Desulfuromonadaceae bacterium]
MASTLFYGFLNKSGSDYVFQSVTAKDEDAAFDKLPLRAVVVGSSVAACEEELYCRQHDC